MAALIARLRARRAQSIADLALVDGRPAFVAASVFRPLTSTIRPLPAGQEPILVSVVRVDGGFVRKLEQRSLLDQAHVSSRASADPRDDSQPLIASTGERLGFVVWRPQTPGRSVFQVLVPSSLAAMALLTVVVGLVLGDLRRKTSRLRASEARAQHLAFHDVLTGLPNRAHSSRTASIRPLRGRGGARAASPCSISILIGSRPSTIASATPPATC